MPAHAIADGAGGKGTWGKVSQSYGLAIYALDHGDPNYDSDEEGEVVLEATEEIMWHSGAMEEPWSEC